MYINTKSKLAVQVLLLTTILLGCGDNTTSAEYIKEARTALNDGKNSEAIINLKNVLKSEKNNAEARFLLGSIYAQQGLWIEAEKELSRAKEYGYVQEELFLLLAKSHYNMSDSAAVKDLLVYSGEFSDKTTTAVKAFLAMAYLKENDLPRGKIALADLLATDFVSKYILLGQALQLGSEDKLEEALAAIDDLLVSNPGFTEALEYQGYLLYTAQRAEESAQSFSLYLNIHPQAEQIRLRYMMSLVSAAKFEEAEEQADILIAIYPKNPLVNQVKAQNRLIEGDFLGAKQFSELALRSKADLLGSIIIAGYSSYKLGQQEMAYSHLSKVRDRLSLQHPARRLLSAISLELGYIDESYEDIKNSPNDDLDIAFLSLSSSQLFKQGDLEKAGYLLDKAQEMEPFSGQLAYQKGVLKMAVNDPESISFFEQAIQSNPEFEQAISLLVMEHLKQKRFDDALKVARSAVDNNIVLSKTLEGVTYKMKGDLILAEQAFNEVLKHDQKNILALFNLGNIAESNDNITVAVTLYQQVLMIDNENTSAINAMYRIGENDKYNALVNERLTELVEIKEHSATETLILVGFYMRDNKVVPAKSVLTKSLEKNPDDFSLRIVQAKMLAFEGEGELALEKLDQILLSFPKALEARKLKVAIFNGKKQSFDTVKEQEIIVKQGLGGENERLNLVFLYIQNNNLEKASQLFSTLPDLSNVSPKYNVVKGKLAFMEANFTQAIRYLKPAYERVPSAPILIDLVDAMQKSNQEKEALALIVAFEENHELTIELMLKKAELYTLKEPEKALAIYERIAQKTNNHFAMLNNIAYILLLQNDLPSAFDYAKKALSKAPNVPAVINTYGLIALAKSNVPEAVKYLSKAYKVDINNQNYLVHYIQALFVDKQYSLVDSLVLKVDKKMLSSDSLARLATVSSS
jgi:putative PEP-CTERM system TPR-repeat lipoprotein